MKKVICIILGSILIISLASAQLIKGTFAIQNTVTGKNLRPFDAGAKNGNRIVLYNHVEWKCMTWDFINLETDTYQLKNLFTSKTFQPKEDQVNSGSALEQQPISNSALQKWEFIKAGQDTYYIRLKGTELYVTASSGDTNSNIILEGKKPDALQLWLLIAQNPTM